MIFFDGEAITTAHRRRRGSGRKSSWWCLSSFFTRARTRDSRERYLSFFPSPFIAPLRPLKIRGYSTPPASKQASRPIRSTTSSHATSVVRKIFATIYRCQNSKYGSSLQTARLHADLSLLGTKRYDTSIDPTACTHPNEHALHSQR
jgi:hypothetical protein